MPLDPGIRELLEAEYRRLLQGLENLTDGGARRARYIAARLRADQVATRRIPVPGWDEVIHLRPRPQITPEMRRAHYEARRRGAPSPLAPELQFEIQRRAEQARSIQNSPTPEYARAYGQVLTAVDNVQDLLTTLATAGRFALAGTASVLDRLAPRFGAFALEGAERAALAAAAGPFARQAAARLGLGLGAQTLGRILPILGPLLLAADILRLLAWLGMLMFPAYAALCQGAREAGAAAALPAAQALLSKRAAKRAVSNLGRVNPFSREARLNRGQQARSWRPTIYNLLEVAQTTDALFGVGLSFGAIVGLVSDSAFGLEQQARGVDVRFDPSPLARTMHRTLLPGIGPMPRHELTDGRMAANVLAHGPMFQRVNPTFTLAEHVDALAAQLAAWSILRPLMERPEMEQAVNVALEVEWAPPVPQWEDSHGIVLEELNVWAGEGLWPLPGNPTRIRGEELLELTAPENARALHELARAYEDEPAKDLIMVMASQLAERAALAITGAREGIAFRWMPEWALLEALALAGRVPNLGQDDARTLAFWRACLAEMARTDRQMLDPETFDRLARETDSELFAAELPR